MKIPVNLHQFYQNSKIYYYQSILKMLNNIKRAMHRLTHTSQILFSKTPQYIQPMGPTALLCENPKPRKRTKTICTIGPKTQSPQNAGKLIDQGMSVARLNFSHGDHEEHRIQMVGVQEALKSRPHSHVSILLDTKGPQIRTGNNATKQPVEVKTGQLLQITTDYKFLGTNKRIACSYADLPRSTEVGRKILIADGGISAKVVKIEDNIVTVQILNDGKIGNKKNVCLPGCTVSLPTIGKNDEDDIINFGLKHKVNYIAVSFARYKKDLDNLRKMLIEKDPDHGPYVQLISKIENHQAIHNLDEIIEGSDGIMVARGDLGMEVPIQKVVILQKYIAQRTINAGKVVITATQMLQSMESKPRPTRAEISDITNSVYDLTDANMTSGQTTNGQFPTQCARILRLVAQQTEASCDYKKIFEHRKQFIKNRPAVGAVSLAFQLQCDFIFLETDNIQLIHRISTLRPHAYIIVFSDNPKVRGAVAIDFGVYVYPKGPDTDPTYFLKAHGQKYGLKETQSVRILKIEMNGDKISSSTIHEVN